MSRSGDGLAAFDINLMAASADVFVCVLLSESLA